MSTTDEMFTCGICYRELPQDYYFGLDTTDGPGAERHVCTLCVRKRRNIGHFRYIPCASCSDALHANDPSNLQYNEDWYCRNCYANALWRILCDGARALDKDAHDFLKDLVEDLNARRGTHGTCLVVPRNGECTRQTAQFVTLVQHVMRLANLNYVVCRDTPPSQVTPATNELRVDADVLADDDIECTPLSQFCKKLL
mgnify:CR=1 FL=1